MRAQKPFSFAPVAVLPEEQTGGKTAARRILYLSSAAAAHIKERRGRKIAEEIFLRLPEIFANLEKSGKQKNGRTVSIGAAGGDYYAVVWERETKAGKRAGKNVVVTAFRLPSNAKKRTRKMRLLLQK